MEVQDLFALQDRLQRPGELPDLDDIPEILVGNDIFLSVTLFLWGQLLLYDDSLTERQAWKSVRGKAFHGLGRTAFEYNQAQWMEKYGGEYGSLFFRKIQEERRKCPVNTRYMTPVSEVVT